MLHIRRATPADVEVLAALNAHVHRPHVAAEPGVYRPTERGPLLQSVAARFDTDAIVLLAEAPEPCGYIVCIPVRREASPYTHPRAFLLVDQLAVDPAARRRGVGRALMEAGEALARELGLGGVELDVRAVNEGARRFYEALGYAPLQTRMGRRL